MRVSAPVQKLERLERLQLFAGLDAKTLARVDSLFTEVEVREGRCLMAQGAQGREAFVILEGQALVASDNEVIAILGPGEVFGEMALLDMGPRTATVTAATDMRVLVTDSGSFRGLLADPLIAGRLLKTVSTRLRRLLTR